MEPSSTLATTEFGAERPVTVQAHKELSVIIPVCGRHDDIVEVFKDYHQGVTQAVDDIEFIYVLDGHYPEQLGQLESLKLDHDDLKIVVLPKSFGEATAITAGYQHSSGRYLLTLPAYQQIQGSALPKMIEQRADVDVLVGSRTPRLDGSVNQIQTRMFNYFVSKISGLQLSDAGCSVRLIKREVLDQIEIYGEFHRFLPVLAFRQGFAVSECELGQAEADKNTRLYSPGLYVRRLLDLLVLYFLARFTRKPFRFFGLIGISTTILGTLITSWTIAERLFGGVALADRPALLIGSLLMVFGLQIISVGLIGELIIYFHARNIPEYSVDRVIE